MSSVSADKYLNAAEKAHSLRETAVDRRLRPISKNRVQNYYHAALALFVAGWDAYINSLVREFFDMISDPLDTKFHAVWSIASERAENALKKFNTPNWENTRGLLVQHIGYDPINDWVWQQRRMGAQEVRERLNEILKVRHSFAHGFSVPAYSWIQNNSGRIRLTNKSLVDVDALFNHLVNVTDRGMHRHLKQTYSIDIWY